MKVTRGEEGVSIRPMTSADLPTAQAVVNEAFVTFIAEMTPDEVPDHFLVDNWR